MTRKEIVKLIKRFLLTFLCALPLFLLIGYFLYDKISDGIMIFIFVVLGGGIFFLEEVIRAKKIDKQKDK